jgi:hypothetical protein
MKQTVNLTDTDKGVNMKTSDKQFTVAQIILVIWFALLIAVVLTLLTVAPQWAIPPVQTSIDVYQHLTIVSKWEGGTRYAIAVYTDDTYASIACDGWDTYEENGQRCVIVGQDSMGEILEYTGLNAIYAVRQVAK